MSLIRHLWQDANTNFLLKGLGLGGPGALGLALGAGEKQGRLRELQSFAGGLQEGAGTQRGGASGLQGGAQDLSLPKGDEDLRAEREEETDGGLNVDEKREKDGESVGAGFNAVQYLSMFFSFSSVKIYCTK